MMAPRLSTDPSTGYPVDPATGDVITPSDPRWQPEWSNVQASNQAAFAPGGSIYNRYSAAQGPWYADPALMGAIALPVGAAAAAYGLGSAGAGLDVPERTLYGGTAGDVVGGVAPEAGGAAAAGGGAGSATSGGGGILSSVLHGAGNKLMTTGTNSLLQSLLGGGNAGNLSTVLGGAAGGLANQQSQQAALAGAKVGAQQTAYQNALQQALMKGVLGPTTGASMARSGDLLANVQDVTPHFTPGMGYSFTGGLRPSALGPNARQAGQNLSNAGLAFQGNQNLPALPNLTSGFPSSTPNGLQQGLQYGALGTGILGALMPQQTPMQQLLAYLAQQGGQQNQFYPTGGGGDQSQPSDQGGYG